MRNTLVTVAAGSFSKGEPEPGIQGWVLYIHIGHKKAGL